MIDRLHLSTILLFAATIWGAVLVLDGIAVTVGWLHPFTIVIGVMLLLLSAFDLALWRIPILQPWFVKRPVIRGTWRAIIHSTWVNPETGKKVDPIACYMVIRQTFSKLSLRLVTRESRSELLGAEILRSEDGTYRIVGVYRNEPKLTLRQRSPIHYGGLVLQVLGSPAVTMEGHYWTDRDTSGEIFLADPKPKCADDLISADALYTKQ